MIKKIQVLGMSEFLPGVIYDIVNDIGQANHLEFFLNTEDEVLKPNMPLFKFPYSIRKMGISPDLNVPMVLGASGPKNKYPIYKYFLENFQIYKSSLVKIIHNTSYVAKSSNIGEAAFIEQHVTISSQTKIGFAVTIKRNSSIGHHGVIGNFVTINPGVTIAGKVTLGDGVLIGIGATLLDGISVGKNTFIGAGSVVTKNIPAGVIAFGNPCKVIRKNTQWEI